MRDPTHKGPFFFFFFGRQEIGRPLRKINPTLFRYSTPIHLSLSKDLLSFLSYFLKLNMVYSFANAYNLFLEFRDCFGLWL